LTASCRFPLSWRKIEIRVFGSFPHAGNASRAGAASKKPGDRVEVPAKKIPFLQGPARVEGSGEPRALSAAPPCVPLGNFLCLHAVVARPYFQSKTSFSVSGTSCAVNNRRTLVSETSARNSKKLARPAQVFRLYTDLPLRLRHVSHMAGGRNPKPNGGSLFRIFTLIAMSVFRAKDRVPYKTHVGHELLACLPSSERCTGPGLHPAQLLA